jgi:hypothetical protein
MVLDIHGVMLAVAGPDIDIGYGRQLAGWGARIASFSIGIFVSRPGVRDRPLAANDND